MKFLRVVLGCFSVGLVGATISASTVHAATVYSSEYTITVTATVLEHRTIIVDANGLITQISSNTDHNITPEVRFLTYAGPQEVLTLEISRQYQHLMGQLATNHIMQMDRQSSPPIHSLMPQSLVPWQQASYVVHPTRVGNDSGAPYIIYE